MQIVYWSEEEKRFVPGVAPFKPRGKVKYTWYRRQSLAWTHDDQWRRNVTKEYQRWLNTRGASANPATKTNPETLGV